ncbi:MAG: fumarate hydratase [Armatimonadetes bacterium RBG_16_58_9]|nr:MAG: fumarate hydratase [Armatimonadetes bacterium RBG_16_58_9]
MREVHVDEIIEKVALPCQDAAYNMREDVSTALRHAMDVEISPMGRHVLDQLLENARLASEEAVPFCHDTGIVVMLVELGQDVRIVGGSLKDALNEGVRRGYVGGYLRASVVRDPFDRVNTGDNTPSIIHYEIVPGDHLTIALTAKGGGSENMSRLAMLKPSDGVEGFRDFVVDTVSQAGPNACPPLLVGVGVGGNFDYCAFLAKKALFREVSSAHPDPAIAELEDEIHTRCNSLGIGPQGMGGLNTVLDVFIEAYACHITALPVAVNIQCPAQRHRRIVI